MDQSCTHYAKAGRKLDESWMLNLPCRRKGGCRNDKTCAKGNGSQEESDPPCDL